MLDSAPNSEIPKTDGAAAPEFVAANGNAVGPAPTDRTVTGSLAKVPLLLAALGGLSFAGWQSYNNRDQITALVSGETHNECPLSKGVGKGHCCHEDGPSVVAAAEEPGSCCSSMLSRMSVLAAAAEAGPVSALSPANVTQADADATAEASQSSDVL